jgi:hypothetical protein
MVFKVWLFIDAVTRRPDVFVAAGKQTKNLWMILLGIAGVWNVISRSPIDLINLAGTVAAIVYFVDVRPALREVSGGPPRPPRSNW